MTTENIRLKVTYELTGDAAGYAEYGHMLSTHTPTVCEANVAKTQELWVERETTPYPL